MKSLKILVGIVTYNRLNTLVKSIDAHLSEGFSEKDILVVDNKSTDGTLAVLKEKYPDVTVFASDENMGSAGGFAQCMKSAVERKYDYVWLYNDDSRPLPGANALMQKCTWELSENDSKFGMLKMAMLRNNKAEILHWRGRRVPQLVPHGTIPIRTDLITFDGCIISTEVIRKIGTCQPSFFMGIYEFDFCLRATDHQYSIYTLPAGLIDDEKMGSAKGSPYWRLYYNTRNHLHLAIKRRSTRILMGFFESELKKTYSILFLQNDKLRKLRYKFKAFYDGMFGRMGRRVFPPASSK